MKRWIHLELALILLLGLAFWLLSGPLVLVVVVVVVVRQLLRLHQKPRLRIVWAREEDLLLHAQELFTCPTTSLGSFGTYQMQYYVYKANQIKRSVNVLSMWDPSV